MRARLLLVICLCLSACPASVGGGGTRGSCPGDALIGLTPILASPASFDGCEVEFTGWLSGSEPEGLCLTESDARIVNSPNCVSIGSFQDSSLRPPAKGVGRAFHVRGVFNRSKTMLVGSPGYLDKISALADVTDPPGQPAGSQ